ncbi:hypothetical protein CGJ88_26030, partial [Vibrio parahaemolyticus]
LPQPRPPQQAEMGRDEAERRTGLQFDFGDQRAARLDPRQVHLVDVADDRPAHEKGVAVPAMGACEAGDRHGG